MEKSVHALMGLVLAVAALVCGLAGCASDRVAAGRVVTDLSGAGWTCDGEPVTVPHTWNAADACDGPGAEVAARKGFSKNNSARGAGYLRKRAVYRRTLPAATSGRRTFLKFDGVSVSSEVFVNGRRVGAHVGAFTAFAFEVTDFLRTDGENVLEVTADNRFNEATQPMCADYSVYGGLYRGVRLIETGAVCIDPVTDGADGVKVAADPKTGEVEVKVRVLGGTNEVQRFRVENHRLWSPEDPVLYTREIRIAQGGATDAVTVRFGFRTFEFRDGRFYLNGKRRQLRGVNRHQDRAGKGWAQSAADEEEDLRLIREMGADALRTAHYPQSRHVYDLCDELGIVCWVEYPNVNRLTFTDEFERGMRRQVKEMVEQLGNHPSIAVWSMFNELYNDEVWMKPAEVEAMIARTCAWVRELDPTRRVAGVMGLWGIPTLNAIPDEFGSNVYPLWYSDSAMRATLDDVLAKSGRKTIAVSEYGVGASVNQHGDPAVRPGRSSGRWHPEEYQAYRMHDNLLELAREDRVWGAFVWAMFDFGADSRMEGERDGINDKGLVTHDRRTLKDAYYLYQANWTKRPVLHLVGSRMKTVAAEAVTVMGFSNVGAVTLKVNGRIVGTRAPDAAAGVVWPAVALKPGENAIELSAGGRTASATWTRTESAE